MSEHFSISDTHFRHANIINFQRHQFLTIEEHDDFLIDSINEVVDPNDYLYHKGDWSMGGAHPKEFRDRINCKNITLILGNHDKKHFERGRFDGLFRGIYTRYEKSFGPKGSKQYYVMDHYAARTWNHMRYCSYMLCGHSHGGLIDALPGEIGNGLLLDCGWDVHKKPISFSEIDVIMREKKRLMQETKRLYNPDHHGLRED